MFTTVDAPSDQDRISLATGEAPIDVERWITDPMLAAQIRRAKPSLVPFQNPNLFFAETTSLHRLSPQLENRLKIDAGHFRGAGHNVSGFP